MILDQFKNKFKINCAEESRSSIHLRPAPSAECSILCIFVARVENQILVYSLTLLGNPDQRRVATLSLFNAVVMIPYILMGDGEVSSLHTCLFLLCSKIRRRRPSRTSFFFLFCREQRPFIAKTVAFKKRNYLSMIRI